MIIKNNIAIRIAGKVSRYIDASMNRATPSLVVSHSSDSHRPRACRPPWSCARRCRSAAWRSAGARVGARRPRTGAAGRSRPASPSCLAFCAHNGAGNVTGGDTTTARQHSINVCLSVCPSVRPSIPLPPVQCPSASRCLSVRPYAMIAVHPSTCLSIILFVCLQVPLSVRPSVRLSVCLSVRLPVCLSVRLPVCLLMPLSACLPMPLSACPSVCPVHPSVRPSVCLSIRPSVRPFRPSALPSVCCLSDKW